MEQGRPLCPVRVHPAYSICVYFTLRKLVKFLPDSTQCRQGVKNADTNCWGTVAWKGVHVPITLHMFFLFLGSIIICKLLKLTLSYQTQVILQLRGSVSSLV